MGGNEPRGRRKLARVRWLFLLDLAVAGVFLVFGNTTARIIGGALLVTLALLVARSFVGRRSDGAGASPRATVLVHRILAVAGLFAIAAGAYGLFAGETEAALALVLLVLGAYCVWEARKHLRLPSGG